ncbi:hypothetical protein IWZ00DRAFT_492782 [Phyllosticta capitalensis]
MPDDKIDHKHLRQTAANCIAYCHATSHGGPRGPNRSDVDGNNLQQSLRLPCRRVSLYNGAAQRQEDWCSNNILHATTTSSSITPVTQLFTPNRLPTPTWTPSGLAPPSSYQTTSHRDYKKFFEKSFLPPTIQTSPQTQIFFRPPTGTLTTQWPPSRLHPPTARMAEGAHARLTPSSKQPTHARTHAVQSQAQLSRSGHPQKAKLAHATAEDDLKLSAITDTKPRSRHVMPQRHALRHANGAAKLRQPRFPTADSPGPPC